MLDPLTAQVAGSGQDRLHTKVVQDLDSLESLAPEWDRLCSRCPDATPCAFHAWVVEWWKAFGEGPLGRERNASLFVVIARGPDGELVAALPLFEENVAAPSFRARRLRDIGTLGRIGVYEMTEEPTALLRPGWEDLALGAIMDTLRAHLARGRWDQASLHFGAGVDPRSVRSALAPMSPRFGVSVRDEPASCMAALPATWSEYRRAVSKSMRDNLGYYPRLLTRHGHDWAVRVRRDPCDMPEAAAAFPPYTRHEANSFEGGATRTICTALPTGRFSRRCSPASRSRETPVLES